MSLQNIQNLWKGSADVAPVRSQYKIALNHTIPVVVYADAAVFLFADLLATANQIAGKCM